MVELSDTPSTKCRLRLAAFPVRLAGNPGVELFYQGLQSHGIHLTHELVFDPKWLTRHAGEIDAIHIQWPEKIWDGRIRGRLDRGRQLITAGRPRGVLRVRRCLDVARELGLKRIWTVHNVEPHEGADWVDRWGYRVVAQHSDLVICYSHAAVDQIRDKYDPDSRIVSMHHGNYVGMYPEPRPRDIVLRELGLSADLPIVSCVGIIRRYKGVDIALEAAKHLEGRVQFVISGKLHDSVDGDQLRQQAESLSNVVYEPRILTDQEYSDRLGACDAALLPFRRITGSGSLLAAWTFGRGTIASDLPLFREMFETQPDAGRLFAVGDAAACADAITRYLAEVSPDRRESAARSITEDHAWQHCVEPVVKALLPES